jgi:hypothetical protein
MLIAWSVAMAPTFGVAAAPLPSGTPSSHHSAGHDHQSAALAHSHHQGVQLSVGGRCCDDEEHAPDHHGLPGDCSTMPGCALKSFSLAPALAANLAVPITISTLLTWHPSRAIPPESPAPPLRPPRS